MKDYYKAYETMHNNVIKACDCISGNPCSNLQSEFENIKSQISGLSLEDGWQDSVGDAFSGVKSSCVSGLDTIIQSISGPFTQSEAIYNELKTTLDNLKTENTNYQNEYNKKPKSGSSEYKNSKGEYDDNKYQKAYNEWKDRVTKLETKCEELQTQANEKKASLDSINGNTISPSLTASLPSAAEKFSQIFTTAAFTSVMDGIDISQYLTTMEFNGQTYQVIDTTNGYQAILNKIGKQNPDGCYDYSAAYLDAIFGSSNASSKSGVATNQNLIATQDEQTALQIMARELLEGRPCIIRVNGKQSTGTRHFVLVTGLNKNADLNNLKQSDFMIMDPASASLKVLNTNVGGQSRHLLKTEDDHGWRGREGDTQGYLIALANKDTEYLGYEGVEQGVAPHVNYNPSKKTGTQRKAELAERAKQAGVTKKTTPIISNSSFQTTAQSTTTTTQTDSVVDSALNWAIGIANDDSYGYSQSTRWGNPNYDCSSLIISAYEQAGIKVKEAGANSTRDMKNAFTQVGFEWIPGDPKKTGLTLQPGDVLLKEGSHTEMYVGDGKNVGAHLDSDGKNGDKKGNEINIQANKRTWDGVLRLKV